jgi:hypothetical protein
VALADKKPTVTEYTSENGRFLVTFPAKPSTVGDEKERATTAGNLMIVTSKCETGGVVYSVTYTDYPATFGIVASKEILDGVVNGMKGGDGKATSEEITADGVKGRNATITAGENVVRARVFLSDRRLYVVMASGKKDSTRGEVTDKFLDSFMFAR